MTITVEQAAKLLDGTTPGPWRKRDCDVVVGEGLTSKTICHFWRHWSNDDAGIEQTEPNARLAAAAPDLARALLASEAARKLDQERLAKAVEALQEARDKAHSHAHDGYDGVWLESDFAELTPKADAILKEIDNG